MHDRAGGHRGLPTAISALVGEGFGLQQPGPAAAATRTDKPFRPPALEKVHRTRAFRRKAVLKFDQRPRKPSLRSRHHPTPRSSRYRGAAYSLVLVLYTKSRSTGRSCIGRQRKFVYKLLGLYNSLVDLEQESRKVLTEFLGYANGTETLTRTIPSSRLSQLEQSLETFQSHLTPISNILEIYDGELHVALFDTYGRKGGNIEEYDSY